MQRRLQIQVDNDDSGALWRVVSRQMLNELYKLGSAERHDLVYTQVSDTVDEVTEPPVSNNSWSANLLRSIIQDGRTTTIATGAGATEASLRDPVAHEAGRASDTQVRLAANTTTIALAHELIHVSHYNEPGAWNEATRRTRYEWRGAGAPVNEPDGREEARTVGLGEYDLDRPDARYLGVTENDLRYIMGFSKRQSYADVTMEPETAVGHHYQAVHNERWASFHAQSAVIAARAAERAAAVAAAAAAVPPAAAAPRVSASERERQTRERAERTRKLKEETMARVAAARAAKAAGGGGAATGGPPPPPPPSAGAAAAATPTTM